MAQSAKNNTQPAPVLIITGADLLLQEALCALAERHYPAECQFADTITAACALFDQLPPATRQSAVITWITDKNFESGAAPDLPGQSYPVIRFSPPLRAGALIDRWRRFLSRPHSADQTTPVIIGPYRLNQAESLLTGPDKEQVRLTEKERAILLCLYKRGGDRITRQDLLDEVWGYAEGVETHTLETHIYRLRQKIEKDPANPALLLTDETGYFLAF